MRLRPFDRRLPTTQSSLLSRNVLVSIAVVTAVGLSACADEEAAPRRKTSKNGTERFRTGDTSTAVVCTRDPSFYDVPGDNCDNDDDGQIDNAPTCDADATGNTASEFAHAIGICDHANGRGFGLVSAAFTQGYGRSDAPRDEQHGLLPKFGNVLRPREGSKLGVLSTGYAKEFNGPGGTSSFNPGISWGNMGRPGAAPPGYPKPTADCPQAEAVNDVVDLKLTLTAPKNVSGFRFDFNFHSSEWPAYICTSFNDGFVAWLSATGFNGGQADNISFDANKNPVSVNNGFFDRCTPNVVTGCQGQSQGVSTCAAGPAELAGTGFGLEGTGCPNEWATRGGATGWLTSRAAVTPGETFTLELMIYDVGDGSLDSSVLIDNFQWIGGNITTSTERPNDVK
ncbi:MAG TPA: choice-of-anchor L domain-containing protein [Labilithrix sp.]|nr:choice-of-anchor L domain-containing protein [Labilithrix sp.]